jgi:hypothetical protein
MTLEKLRQITNHLPADTVLLVDTDEGVNDVETIYTEYHADGRAHLIFTDKL